MGCGRPYIMDLESVNKTKLNGEFIPPARYIELKVRQKQSMPAHDSLYRVQDALTAISALGYPSITQKGGSKQLC
jgi:hypothetical protein